MGFQGVRTLRPLAVFQEGLPWLTCQTLVLLLVAMAEPPGLTTRGRGCHETRSGTWIRRTGGESRVVQVIYDFQALALWEFLLPSGGYLGLAEGWGPISCSLVIFRLVGVSVT